MSRLAETQAAFRVAVADEEQVRLPLQLVAPRRVDERFAVYRRHYREGFRRHLRGRYPTLEWLVGTDRMIAFADALVRRAPPLAPSLAEYGAGLIDVVAAGVGEGLPAYLPEAARLDWMLGQLSVQIDRPGLPIADFAMLAPELLPDVVLDLQPCVAYLACSWPVDMLLHVRLGGAPPDRLAVEAEQIWLELRGMRGKFSFRRLGPGEYSFRQALGVHRPLGWAVDRAVDADPAFDLAPALARLFGDGLVIAMYSPKTGGSP